MYAMTDRGMGFVMDCGVCDSSVIYETLDVDEVVNKVTAIVDEKIQKFISTSHFKQILFLSKKDTILHGRMRKIFFANFVESVNQNKLNHVETQPLKREPIVSKPFPKKLDNIITIAIVCVLLVAFLFLLV